MTTLSMCCRKRVLTRRLSFEKKMRLLKKLGMAAAICVAAWLAAGLALQEGAQEEDMCSPAATAPAGRAADK